MKKMIAFFLMCSVQGVAADVVDDFSRRTGLPSGGDYKPVPPSNKNCPEGEFSIEADENGGVLVRLGPDILADGVSLQPVNSPPERTCITTHKTTAIETGKVDTLKEMRCKVKGMELVQWHSVFTVTPAGFNHVLTFANGNHRDCYFKRQ